MGRAGRFPIPARGAGGRTLFSGPSHARSQRPGASAGRPHAGRARAYGVASSTSGCSCGSSATRSSNTKQRPS